MIFRILLGLAADVRFLQSSVNVGIYADSTNGFQAGNLKKGALQRGCFKAFDMEMWMLDFSEAPTCNWDKFNIIYVTYVTCATLCIYFVYNGECLQVVTLHTLLSIFQPPSAPFLAGELRCIPNRKVHVPWKKSWMNSRTGRKHREAN